jgi:2-methylaconitate cis-trans-isomerase PrpF
LDRLERIRLQAGRLMGLGDVSNSVLPKPVIVSPTEDNQSINSRYFTPKRCHTSHAVTGAIGVATALALRGTVAHRHDMDVGTHNLRVLHPSGVIQIALELGRRGDQLEVSRASVVRTARKIIQGNLEIPARLWAN